MGVEAMGPPHRLPAPPYGFHVPAGHYPYQPSPAPERWGAHGGWHGHRDMNSEGYYQQDARQRGGYAGGGYSGAPEPPAASPQFAMGTPGFYGPGGLGPAPPGPTRLQPLSVERLPYYAAPPAPQQAWGEWHAPSSEAVAHAHTYHDPWARAAAPQGWEDSAPERPPAPAQGKRGTTSGRESPNIMVLENLVRHLDGDDAHDRPPPRPAPPQLPLPPVSQSSQNDAGMGAVDGMVRSCSGLARRALEMGDSAAAREILSLADDLYSACTPEDLQ
ncbi:hypothetical protein T484DRAFT_1824697 [Baffinella frigidus]|nr:hypothetical protein T484DRAFT_1824697 [Cryptophyta sp. CCMP2293]